MSKISDLPVIDPATLTGAETVPVVKDGATGRANFGQMLSSQRVFGYEDFATGLAATVVGARFRVINPEAGVASDEYAVSGVANRYNPAAKVANAFVGTGGKLMTGTGWARSGFIDISDLPTGASITISAAAARRAGHAFYTGTTEASYIANSYAVAGANLTDFTVTKPAGANFIVFNLASDTIPEPAQIQLEAGATKTTYYPFGTKLTELLGRVAAYPPAIAAKDYEITYVSPNLFDPSKKVSGSLVGTDGKISEVAGWVRTEFIDISDLPTGASITISAGAERRVGHAFYTTAAESGYIAGTYSTQGANVTAFSVTKPAGANFVVFNLASDSIPEPPQVQIEVGETPTAYEPFGQTDLVGRDFISPAIREMATELVADLATGDIKGNSRFEFPLAGKTATIVFSPALQPSLDRNGLFQFHSSQFDGAVVSGGEFDNIAPYRFNGATLGAGHGYARTICTLGAHGKTAADLYSEWQDGDGNRWVIVGIDSASAFSVTAKTGNGHFSGGQLTHVTGAANTASVTPTSVSASQLYPIVANRGYRMEIDGQPWALADETLHPARSIAFLESYEIREKDSLVAWAIANRAGAQFTEFGGTSLVSVSQSYTFDRQGVVQTGDFLALANVAEFKDIMFIQARNMDEGTGNGPLRYYIPNTIAFSQDGQDFDFANVQDMTDFAPANSFTITPARSEPAPALLPDRVLMMNDKIGIAVGILPVQDAAPAVRRVNASRKALEIRNNTKKIYLSTIDRADKASLVEGDYFSAVTYRRYFDPTAPRWAYTVPAGSEEFIFIHWQDTALVDTVPMPGNLVGRPFEVVEAKGCAALSQTIGSALRVDVNAAGGNAHLVLKVAL